MCIFIVDLRYKINTQKSVLFLYVNDDYTEKEIREIALSTLATRGEIQVNLPNQGEKGLYNEVVKPQKIEIEEVARRLNDELINIIKMTIPPKTIWRFTETSIKNQCHSLQTDIAENNLKFICREWWIVKPN